MASNGENPTDASSGYARNCKLYTKALCVVVSTIVGILLIIVAVCLLGVKAKEKNEYCESNSAPVTRYASSGSVTLLKSIDNFECIKPAISAQLNSAGTLALYQAPCSALKTIQFQVDRTSLPYSNVTKPIVVFSEDFSDNYFLSGRVDVNVNATFGSNPATYIYVCLFLDLQAFNNFTNFDKDWRDYVEKANCRVTSKEQFKTTFDIESPSYVFIAMATTGRLSTLQFGYNGTAKNYGQSLDNMLKVCSLDDKAGDSQCSFSVVNNDTKLCLLASTELNADGSIDYISITLTFVQNMHTVIVFIVSAVVISIACLIVIILIFIVTCTNCLPKTLSLCKSLNHVDYHRIN